MQSAEEQSCPSCDYLIVYMFSRVIYDLVVVAFRQRFLKGLDGLSTFCRTEGYLLRKQVDSLREKHKNEAGLTGRLYRKRKELSARDTNEICRLSI